MMKHILDVKELNGFIYLIGRDDNQNKICEKRPNPYLPFNSYFYIKEDSLSTLDYLDCNIEITNHRRKSLFDDNIIKVFYKTNSSSEFYQVRDFMEMNSDILFEGDVFLRTLYSLDVLQKEKGIDFEVIPRKLFLDIETTYSTGGIKYDNPTDEVLCVTFYDSFTKKYYYFYWGEENVEREGDLIYKYKNEVEMVEGVLRWLKEMNCDILLGWWVHFDVTYLLNRYKKICNSEKLIRELSPMGYCKYSDKYKQYSIFGIIIFDLLKGYQRIVRGGVPSYKLDNIAEIELGEKKIEVDIKTLNQLSQLKLYEYNRKDVELCVKLDDKLNIFKFHDTIRKFIGSPFDTVEYTSSIIDFLLLKKARELNIALPNKSKKGVKMKFEGAFVDAVPGNYENVVCFDLKAFYPNIIKTFNLSKETITSDGEIKLQDNITITKKKRGIIPLIIDELLELRYEYDTEKDKYSFDDPNYEKFDILVEAVKCCIDGIFGVNAYLGFRLFAPAVSSSITYIGRETILRTREKMKELGYNVILSDTDSVDFVSKSSNVDDIIKESYDLLKIINDDYKSWMYDKFNIDKDSCYIENAFKKIYKKMIVSKKKRYVGKVIWTKGHISDGSVPEIVGHEFKRSDYSNWARDFQYILINKLLNEEPREIIKDFIMGKYAEMKIMELSKIAIPTKIEKNLEDYTTNLPKIRGAKYSKKKIDIDIGKGDKPLLLFTKGESDIILFYEESEVKELLKYVKIDWDKMSERNIFMIIGSLLENNGMIDLLNEIKMELSNQKTLSTWGIKI